MKPAVNEIQAKPTTGAVDKYVMKFCIEGIYFFIFLRVCVIYIKMNSLSIFLFNY
jgi:hypothetical protein